MIIPRGFKWTKWDIWQPLIIQELMGLNYIDGQELMKKAIWIGGLRGTFYNSIIEILDGFSENWGASMGDFASNSIGSFIAISQELYWKEQRILIKYSYSRSDLSYENSELFGDNFFQRTFKDYNGQTYWISMNINSMFKADNSQFPDWLNLALGHSAKDMISPNNTLQMMVDIDSFFYHLILI